MFARPNSPKSFPDAARFIYDARMPVLDLWFASGEASLSVRRFATSERMFELFEVDVVALSPNDDLDFDAIVGKPAAFYLAAGTKHVTGDGRRFAGVCSRIEQTRSESKGLSTYRLRIVPSLWLSSQRRNHRTFQHLSVPEIVGQLLDDWKVIHEWHVDRSEHPKLELRVQYGETDYDFLKRMLEEAGISFYFRDGEGDGGNVLVLHERPDRGEIRVGGPIRFVDNPNESAEREFLTDVHVTQEVRPGHVVLRDHDFRRPPEYRLEGKSAKAAPQEEMLQQHHYVPGAFLVEGARKADTPFADDRGAARHQESAGAALAERRLHGLRATRRVVSFQTSVVDVRPGVLFTIDGHSRAELAPDRRLLAVEMTMEGSPIEEWMVRGRAVFADTPYQPSVFVDKPQIHGVESAIVVGPKGEEIHTDEFGRVRVQFHWDRYGDYSDRSLCWVRVSQGWAGSAYGMMAIPRVGQEVIVAFLGGNPDQPVIVGRLYNSSSPVPYKLPENKTVSTWKSDSTPGSNGFNEIKFDDARGRELVYMQAERDLEKLVKFDEREKTGRVRRIEVGERIEITTGKASIIIDGPDITLRATGDLRYMAEGRIISHGGPVMEMNPSVPEWAREKVVPPEKFPPLPKRPGVSEPEPYAQGIAMVGFPDFRERVRGILDKLKATRTGRAVMKKIARSGQGVAIVETRTPNVVSAPTNLVDASWQDIDVPGEGSSSVVAFNPDFSPNGLPPQLALGNALISSWHGAIGEREVGDVDGVKKQTLKTIGLAPYSKLRPCENRLRRDMGLPILTDV